MNSFLELLILPALRRQIHRHRLRVFRANSTFSISFTNFVHSVLQAVLISKWSRTPRLSKPLMTTPILIRSDSVFCFMLPPRDSSFNICQGNREVATERGWQQIHKFRNCRGSYRRTRSRYASSPTALSLWAPTAVLVLLSTWSTRGTAQWKCSEAIPLPTSVSWAPGQRWLPIRLGVLQQVRRFLPAHHQKKSSRPTAKHSSPFSPRVVLAFARLALILRRKRADPMLLL